MNFSKCVFTVISIVEMLYFDTLCGKRFSNRIAIQSRAGRVAGETRAAQRGSEPGSRLDFTARSGNRQRESGTILSERPAFSGLSGCATIRASLQSSAFAVTHGTAFLP
ncbi:hypothetical protein [Paraburkholderia humisilvae]|uniref:hypothetical protein n=1 Tax=Paraburkholderia humisilvae TaxID=627669 RepID=UPI0015815779|nr:hypothetical protein [Paraburkholderia humisilvae]